MDAGLKTRRIVVPTDFGDAAKRAADIAADLAERSRGCVNLVHVWGVPPSYAEALSWPYEELESSARKALDEEAARIRESHAGVEVTVSLAMGEPWEVLSHCITEKDVDLVVIGTHGRKGLPRLWLGSVAERVVRASPVPVLTVHAAGPG